MKSYPGDILRRFGRYEAVEDLGVSALAHLWGAWDPYLERFVIIAALGDVDGAELMDGMHLIDAALQRWTGGKLGGEDLILDFSPGDADCAPFVVVAPTDEEEDGAAVGGLDDHAPPEGAAAVAPQRGATALTWTQTERQSKSRSAAINRPFTPPRALSPLLLVAVGALLLSIGAASGFVMRSMRAGGDRDAALAPVRTFTPTAVPTWRTSAAQHESSATATPAPTEAGSAAPFADVPTAPSVALPLGAQTPPAPPTATNAAIGTPTSPLDGWRAGRLLIDIAAPREPVAAGETVKLRAVLSGLSALDLSRLECEWQVGGTPVSHVCDELELRADPQPRGEPLVVGLSAQGQTKQVMIVVHTAAPSPAATAATAVPAAQRPKPVGPRALPTINTRVSAGEAGVHGAIAAYVRDQQRALVERTGKDVRCVLRQQSTRQTRDGWDATATYTIDIPGQPILLTNEALHIVDRAGTWHAEKP